MTSNVCNTAPSLSAGEPDKIIGKARKLGGSPDPSLASLPWKQSWPGNSPASLPAAPLAWAKLLSTPSAPKGDKIIATARTRGSGGVECLAPLKAAGAAVLQIDVAAPQDVLNAKAKVAWAIYGHVDVLVKNVAEQFSSSALRNNVIDPLDLTLAFLPLMRACQSDTLLFMSSVGAHCGSKGLLEGIVPNLTLEIAPFGLLTCLIIPGYMCISIMMPSHI
ncbi:hypothetical protein VTN00DRAFT_1230 [Thermoascus crustaceus]|uniref:uncharacterized protein n=1 Tax=Thermoascus crustaceus TaxID=5088 RepID=UPI003742F0EC